jgi:hypothetical protein
MATAITLSGIARTMSAAARAIPGGALGITASRLQHGFSGVRDARGERPRDEVRSHARESPFL